MKSLPVYELGQWLKNKGAIGRIVARSVGQGGFGILPEFDSNAQVHGMSDRGLGYCVEWIKLEFGLSVDGAMPPIVGFTPLRLRWIGSKTMADPRYQPCENPIALKVEAEKPEATEPSNVDAETTIESKDNAESIMRAMVDTGRRAEDWLRAYGFTL